VFAQLLQRLFLLEIGGLELVFRLGELAGGLVQLARAGGKLVVQLLRAGLLGLELVGAGEDTGVFGGAAAGHGAAGVDELAVERHDAKLVLVPLRHGDRVRKRFAHDGAAEEIGKDVLIFGVEAGKLQRGAEVAGLVLGSLFQFVAPDDGHGQKGRAARFPAL